MFYSRPNKIFSEKLIHYAAHRRLADSTNLDSFEHHFRKRIQFIIGLLIDYLWPLKNIVCKIPIIMVETENQLGVEYFPFCPQNKNMPHAASYSSGSKRFVQLNHGKWPELFTVASISVPFIQTLVIVAYGYIRITSVLCKFT